MYKYFFNFRKSLKQLIAVLNNQKNEIKKSGLVVDGKQYNIKFTGKF